MESQLANTLLDEVPTLALELPFFGLYDATPLALALGMFIISYLVLWILRAVILHHLDSLLQKRGASPLSVFISALRGVGVWVYILVSIYISAQFFSLNPTADMIFSAFVYFVLAWQLVSVVSQVVEHVVSVYTASHTDEEGSVDPNTATMSNLVSLIVRILLWVFGGIFILSNLGIEITSLVAGLGIGGVAIAFALQGVLSDLFASFSIYFDKPFRIGDFVVIGTDAGTVEKIGIKSTRIRTLQGEELVVPNNELVSARVQNFKKMKERRIVFSFGITYETPYEKVRRVNEIVAGIFEDLEEARLDRVHFTSFGDSALLFEVVYHVKSSNYNTYMNIQQSVNWMLMERFGNDGIDFAYPTQTIMLKKVE